jgi:methionyl-tRNA formyltransferase
MTERLRIVVFNVFSPAYQMLLGWATKHGHQIILLVTSPARQGDRYPMGYVDLIGRAPREQAILVTSRLKKIAAPVIAALAPDLILSATFPHRIPAEITGIPRYGAYNLHPAPLPRGRGPVPQRLLYEGDLTLAGALHRISPEFDAGAVISCQRRRLPDAVTPDLILATWGELMMAALEDGVPRIIAGERGEEQDEALATYAGVFTEEEHWLSWEEPGRTIQRRAAALNFGGPAARGRIDGDAYLVWQVEAHPGVGPNVPPGTLLDRNGDLVRLRVGDGMIEALTRRWAPPEQ